MILRFHYLFLTVNPLRGELGGIGRDTDGFETIFREESGQAIREMWIKFAGAIMV